MLQLMVMNNPLPGPAHPGLSAEPTHPILPTPYPVPLLVAGLHGLHFQLDGSLKDCYQACRCTLLLTPADAYWGGHRIRVLIQWVMPGRIALLVEPCPGL